MILLYLLWIENYKNDRKMWLEQKLHYFFFLRSVINAILFVFIYSFTL